MKSLSGLEIEFLVTFSKLGNLSLGIQRRLNKDRAWEKTRPVLKTLEKYSLFMKKRWEKDDVKIDIHPVRWGHTYLGPTALV